MKKVIALILTLCTLICTLSACHSRRDKYTPNDTETDTEQETQAPGIDFDESPYAGMAKQDLIELYHESLGYCTSRGMSLNTPFYYITNPNQGGTAYSKLSGGLVDLCKDPLCDHTQCVFCGKLESITASDERLYLLCDYASVKKVYTCDLQFDGMEEIISWDATNAPSSIFYFNGALYYSAAYRKNGETKNKVFVVDLKTHKIALYKPDEDTYDICLKIIGQYLYYRGNDGVWRHNLATGEDVCVLPDSVMDPANGDLQTWFDYASYDGSQIMYQVLKQEGRNVWAESFCRDLTTNTTKPWSNGIVAGHYIVSHEDHTEEAFKDDPFYEFYRVNIMFSYKNPSGGELTYYCVNDGTTGRAVKITTNGIPVNLRIDNVEFGSDGKCIYVSYMTYLAYANEYNEDFTLLNSDDMREANSGLLVLDLDNQKEYHFGPGLDVEWYPDRTN